MTFLKAEWRKLILVNYTIDPNTLNPFIPEGTVLDLYNNNCYVSLVGFMFKNTKILGLKIPGHHTFEEVNLRFYVKRKVGKEILENLRTLIHKSKLVHGDFSEFNILYSGKIVFIDFSTTTLLRDPNSVELLVRDIKNLRRLFKKFLIPMTEEQV